MVSFKDHKITFFHTKTLAHPYSKHIELQKSVVDSLTTLVVHEKMVHEAKWNGNLEKIKLIR